MLAFATGNKHKFAEVESVLSEYGIGIEQKPIALQELNSTNAKEIALHKARQAFSQLRKPLIAEDTGFYFKAFKDFPGTIPKRIFESIGYEGMLKLLEGKKREAYCLATICFMESEDTYRFFEGKLEGKISEKVIKPKANVMPYERIFIPKGSKKALAELTREEKNDISHRAIAARKLGEWLKERTLHDLIESL